MFQRGGERDRLFAVSDRLPQAIWQGRAAYIEGQVGLHFGAFCNHRVTSSLQVSGSGRIQRKTNRLKFKRVEPVMSPFGRSRRAKAADRCLLFWDKTDLTRMSRNDWRPLHAFASS
jgi:hypothetical protein